MGKLIKYEIRGSYKIIIGVLIIMALLNVFLLSKLNLWSFENILIFTILSDFAAFLFIFIYSINSFKRELYEERGYLTLTLPVRGSHIVGSKLIVTLIWFTIASVVACIFMLMLNKSYVSIILKEIVEHMGVTTLTLLSNIMGTIIVMSMIYFSVSASKIAIKSKRIGGILGFIVFIGLSILIGYIGSKLVTLFPQSIIIGKSIGNNINIHMGTGSLIQYSGDSMQINIAFTIYSILLAIGLFISTSFIIEKKIDL